MQHVQQLPLVLVQALDLDVEDGVGVQGDPLLALGPAGKGLLVVPLDLLQPGEHRRVIGEAVQVRQVPGVGEIPVADAVPDQAVQAGVDLADPAAVVHAVGDVSELVRLHAAGVPEHVAAENVGVQGGHAVDGHAPGDAEIGHVHHAVPDNRHFLRLFGVVIEVVHLLLPAPRDLLHDLPDAGQQGLEQPLGPALQCLGQHGVVGIGHGVAGDVPGLVPAQARVVDEDAHQLRDHQRRVGVVDLDDVLLVEVLQGAVGLDVPAGDGLQGGRHEEILLLQPQGLALVVVVLGIEDGADGVGHGPLLVGLQVLPLAEQLHINGLGALGVPQAQGVHMVGVVARHQHIAGDGQHPGIVLVDHHQVAVVPPGADPAAEVNFLGLLGLGHQPRVPQVQPVVGQLHLLTVHDLLLENAQLIADGVAGGGNVQGGHAVQIAGGQAAQAAVAKARVRLHVEDIRGGEAQLLHRLGQLGQNAQVVCVFHEAAAHQELQGHIVHPLFLLLLGALLGVHAAHGHNVPQGQGAGLHDLPVGGLLFRAAIVQAQLLLDGLLQGVFGISHLVVPP